ncbi:MAG: DUF4339 domain-containing protein [Waddliaceae bacterium]
MDKIWYIIIDGIEEGPYSIRELSLNSRVNLDTIAWKEGFDSWKAIRDIPELRALFEEEPPKEEEGEESKAGGLVPQEELVLDLQKEPSFFFLWVIIAVIIIFYVCYELYWW